VPEGVFERRLLRPTAQPAEPGEGGETSTLKLVVPVALHLQNSPRIMCATGGPTNLLAPQSVSQSGPNAWISEIRDYLKENILPEDHVSAERIVRLAKRYAVVEGDLYRCGTNNILMRCITREEGCELLTEIHGGECGSHSSSCTLVGKAFRHSFYWPTALQDAAEMVKSCKACQFHAKQIHTPVQALQMIPPSWPFAVWGVDILGPFPRAVGGYRFLFIAIDKFTKWPEATPVVNITQGAAVAFLRSIVCRFGVPRRIITDNGTQFTSRLFQEYCEGIGTQLCFASMSHPRSNDQAERENTEILRGLKTRIYDCLKSMVRIGSMSFRPYFGGTGPHPAELLGRPRSSWSTGPKPAFPQKSLWAPQGSSLSMSLCRNNYDVRTWTSSTSANGERRSGMHGTTKRLGATTNDSCIVGSSGSGT
jgi:transposase InsO family protein